MQVPAELDRAGWYVYSPAPGDVGPAVIAGRVDSRAGPVIFSRSVRPGLGDLIELTRGNRAMAVFPVTASVGKPASRVFEPLSGLRPS